jgi:hypothetical protein
MDRKLLTFLENLKYEVKGNTQLLNILIKQNNKQNECMTTDIPEGLTVTIGNVQDFETMDEKLQNETLAQKLVGGPPFDTGLGLRWPNDFCQQCLQFANKVPTHFWRKI